MPSLVFFLPLLLPQPLDLANCKRRASLLKEKLSISRYIWQIINPGFVSLKIVVIEKQFETIGGQNVEVQSS
jgi:hypothetical protein